jgi:phage FluMu protein Com
MKTSIKLLLSVSAIVALSFTASAFDQLKGGQVQIGQTPAAVRLSTDIPAAPAMACPQCKDVRGTSSTPIGRGAYVKTASYTQHLCPTCKTTTTTTSMGKTQLTHKTHTCASGADASCCAMN